MKNYEKPRLMFLSLNGNDRLCGDCANNGGKVLNEDPGTAQFIMDGLGIEDVAPEGPSKSDFENVFAKGEQGCTKYTHIEAYCKFTSTADRMVAWS